MTLNAPARPIAGTMDVDEFMAFLEMRPKEERWHLIEGMAVMMAPPSLALQRIALNFCELLNRAFAAHGRDLYAYHEIAVRLPGVTNFQPEPDVVVAPGTAGYEVYTEDFRLVAEILSPSNTRDIRHTASSLPVRAQDIWHPRSESALATTPHHQATIRSETPDAGSAI